MSLGLLEELPVRRTDKARAPLLLGDEAAALAAIHAGIGVAYAYPGTPSTEILEFVQTHAADHGITAHWCANEKTAYEQALGASMVGVRALVSMKQVGLNVAMDPFVNSALVSIHGGLVVVVADDPGMHSSQNEQDSRVLADFARIPCLEPATQQETYDMTRAAFELSERFAVPVMVRLVTRLCHGRAEVIPAPADEGHRAPRRLADAPDWTLLPANGRRLWEALLDAQPQIAEWTASSPWVGGELPDEMAPLGVVTAGIARNYLEEALSELDAPLPHVHVGAYPPPTELLSELARRVDRIVVLEEGYPFLEARLRGMLGAPVLVEGKESGHVTRTGELTPETVRHALGLPLRQERSSPLVLPKRPPQLCQGCPHRDTFAAVSKAIAELAAIDGGAGAWDPPVVAGDIGCYTLGALPPYGALDSCVCMGASIGMAKGSSDAGAGPTLAVIGDSTFLHSGLTGMVDATAHDTDMTVLILDNGTVAMTGQQPTALPNTRVVPILKGLGVQEEHLHVVDVHPRRTDELAALIRREVEHHGLSVIVAVRPCIEAVRKKKKERGKSGSKGAASADGGNR